MTDAWSVRISGGGVTASGPSRVALEAAGFLEAFSGGSGVRLPAEPAVAIEIEVVFLGELMLTSGRLAGLDPVAPSRVDVPDLEIAPGAYPCFLSRSVSERAATGLMVRLGDGLPTHWEDATAIDGEPGEAAVDVDSGTVALADAEFAGQVLTNRRQSGKRRKPQPGGLAAKIHAALASTGDEGGVIVPGDRGDIAVAHFGDDYSYPLVQGRDDDGRVTAVLIDSCLLPLCAREDAPDAEWE